METAIPFMGFYETIHAHRVDQMLGVSDDDYYMAKQEGKDVKELDDLLDTIDWKKEHADYARQFAGAFSDLVKIPLTYKLMQSPREYNFTTDRIFCEIAESDVEKLKSLVDPVKIRAMVKERFTSRSGFSSFYSADYDEWLKQEEEFYHNQIETLLECRVIELEGDDWEINMLDSFYC